MIFDTPPVGTFVDAAVLSASVDGALLVVRDDFTKRSELLAAYEQLSKAGGRIIGAVLNNCEVETSEYYYAYYTKDGKRVKNAGKAPSLPTSSASVPQTPRGHADSARTAAAVRQRSTKAAMPAARGQAAPAKNRPR